MLKEEIIKNNLGTVTSKDYFYVGDPCYVLSDENYDIFCAEMAKKDLLEECDGIIETPEGKFIAHYTLCGDGEYESQVGNILVDSGNIAIIPMKLVDEDKVKKHKRSIEEFGAIVPGKEAQVVWITGSGAILVEYEGREIPAFSEIGTFIVDIKDPDFSFRIVTGSKDIEEYEDDNNLLSRFSHK